MDDEKYKGASGSSRLAKGTKSQKKAIGSSKTMELRNASTKNSVIIEDDNGNDSMPLSPMTSNMYNLSDARFGLFKSSLQAAISGGKLVSSDEGAAWSINNEIQPAVNAVISESGTQNKQFSDSEVLLALDQLQAENRVFVSGDSVYMI
ncbi:hypothetical protein BB559_004669 [Furculomyces boomerangus]|uniref:MCM3-like winged helix domain-containing protein n=2 Tax=Harpellales TaxID=61421 RepID=A0A2T9YDJ2_9FUNG|nr:hypothetical protein BB559_004669 [Furculomyces boomerangus]PVZ96449.1 hypothetical protein BB558_007675 [Smittium angustum]